MRSSLPLTEVRFESLVRREVDGPVGKERDQCGRYAAIQALQALLSDCAWEDVDESSVQEKKIQKKCRTISINARVFNL